ncbi:MAG: universal stress protein, partial [Winogradskyella sp.]|nr:universal stress protein [Winogradskyella sp.]
MKKILVPTDFSGQADYALHVASQLAKRHRCEIYLLHMLELPINEIDALSSHSDLPEAMFYMKLARKRFDEVLEKPFLKNIKVHEIVKFHQAFDGIIDTCKEYKIDLIIMGSHGVSGFKDMFIEKKKKKVVRTSEV